MKQNLNGSLQKTEQSATVILIEKRREKRTENVIKNDRAVVIVTGNDHGPVIEKGDVVQETELTETEKGNVNVLPRGRSARKSHTNTGIFPLLGLNT